MELHIVPTEDIDKYQDILSPYMESFVTLLKGRYEYNDIFEQIKSGKWKLWVTHQGLELQAVIITQIVEYPRVREFQILLCHGEDYKKWYDLISEMEAYAGLSGCNKIAALGRTGWEKIMHGYKKSYICLERDL